MLKIFRRMLSRLGPGFITGAADDDPAGIATYSQTGAQFGFNQLWTAPFSFPLMTCMQEMCGRIGIITNMGLTGLIKQHYAKPILYLAVLLLTIANTFNIGADLGAMAEAIRLIIPVPFYPALIGIAISTLLLEIFVSYPYYSQYLKYLTASLLAYIATAFFIDLNWQEIVLSTILPHISFSKEYFMNLTALFGTTISPYLFFWQTNQEVEENGLTTTITVRQRLFSLRIDTIIGMLFSNIVMWFIIAITGATLCKQGICSISTAHEAALALRPLAGNFAFILFAIGILGTGLLAVPILAGSAAYAIGEMMGWPSSLSYSYTNGKKFYRTLACIFLMGIAVNFLPLESITLLYYSAMLNGIISPILIFVILMIANNKVIMGNNTNSYLSNALGLCAGIIMSLVASLLLVSILL